MTNYSISYRIHQRMIWLKCILLNIWYPVFDRFYTFFHTPPKIASISDTLNLIINNKCSVARFGDGEMQLAWGGETSFQSSDSLLQTKLSEIPFAKNNNLLVCIPDVFDNLDQYREFDKQYWKNHLAKTRIKWYNSIDSNRQYYNAFISRFYMPYRDKSNTSIYIKLWKRVWDKKKLLIVEGEKTRLGVGNDLFDNAASIQRILCPNTQAFRYYHQLLNEILKFDTDRIILLAIGPTATIIASDLSKKGYQALDVGHIDIEYSWFKMGATEKVAVNNKFVNEAPNGRTVSECNDQVYNSQIICKF